MPDYVAYDRNDVYSVTIIKEERVIKLCHSYEVKKYILLHSQAL